MVDLILGIALGLIGISLKLLHFINKQRKWKKYLSDIILVIGSLSIGRFVVESTSLNNYRAMSIFILTILILITFEIFINIINRLMHKKT